MRLFLALTPPPELRERLGELADVAHARCGGRRMPDESLHLTLAFLGEVEEVKATELVEWAQCLTIEPGRWHIERWGSFRRPGIVWVGGSKPDPALERLQGRVWGDLESFGLGTRPASFIPHVTLLRHAVTLDLAGFAAIDLAWSYNQLELIESIIDERGAHYRSLAVSQG
ncbi:RNA 2',3'-cyclic phosphodiesterase [Halomonas sp. A29]|uniref:RNA 2',3'-cyclic phosphodiesterase n=1 Tax=Halomonas sp. A29 TaxID=3102786 RepID=UPI00398B098A